MSGSIPYLSIICLIYFFNQHNFHLLQMIYQRTLDVPPEICPSMIYMFQWYCNQQFNLPFTPSHFTSIWHVFSFTIPFRYIKFCAICRLVVCWNEHKKCKRANYGPYIWMFGEFDSFIIVSLVFWMLFTLHSWCIFPRGFFSQRWIWLVALMHWRKIVYYSFSYSVYASRTQTSFFPRKDSSWIF